MSKGENKFIRWMIDSLESAQYAERFFLWREMFLPLDPSRQIDAFPLFIYDAKSEHVIERTLLCVVQKSDWKHSAKYLHDKIFLSFDVRCCFQRIFYSDLTKHFRTPCVVYRCFQSMSLIDKLLCIECLVSIYIMRAEVWSFVHFFFI